MALGFSSEDCKTPFSWVTYLEIYGLSPLKRRVERAFKQDIEQFQSDTTQLGHRLETLENKFEEVSVALLKDKCCPGYENRILAMPAG